MLVRTLQGSTPRLTFFRERIHTDGVLVRSGSCGRRERIIVDGTKVKVRMYFADDMILILMNDGPNYKDSTLRVAIIRADHFPAK